MKTRIHFPIQRQPNDTTCGPTCLHAVYSFFGLDLSLEQVIEEVPTLEDGGTLAVNLACHALRQGLRAKIYSYNLQIFDPTWFSQAEDLSAKLRAQMRVKPSPKLQIASKAYLEFLKLGGELRMEDLSPELIAYFLAQNTPIITGLSATYLYRKAREYGPQSLNDDINGVPSGHFVVLTEIDPKTRMVRVADPYLPTPEASHLYTITLEHLVCSIMLGIVTYDANLLIIYPEGPH